MITIITALAPAFAIMFIFTRELPFMFKVLCYMLPNWLLSLLISLVIITPLAGWMVGPLAFFLGEFVVYPWLVIDKRSTLNKIDLFKRANMWPIKFRDNTRVMVKAANIILKESNGNAS
jgi:hypothetical protein